MATCFLSFLFESSNFNKQHGPLARRIFMQYAKAEGIRRELSNGFSRSERIPDPGSYNRLFMFETMSFRTFRQPTRNKQERVTTYAWLVRTCVAFAMIICTNTLSRFPLESTQLNSTTSCVMCSAHTVVLSSTSLRLKLNRRRARCRLSSKLWNSVVQYLNNTTISSTVPCQLR